MDNEERNSAAGWYDAVRDGEVGVTELTKEQRALVLSEARRRLKAAQRIVDTIEHNARVF